MKLREILSFKKIIRFIVAAIMFLSTESKSQQNDLINKDTTLKAGELKDKILQNDINKYHYIDQLVDIEGERSSEFFQSLFLIDPLNKNGNNKRYQESAGYGIRKILEVRAKKVCKEFIFCPVCKEKLSEYHIIDIYLIGLHCANGHKFHIEVKHGQFTDSALVANGENWLEIAKIWLTNDVYRSQVATHQVAEIIRAFVEGENKLAANVSDLQFEFCPVCSNKLFLEEQEDVWVERLVCENKHYFSSRAGILYNNVALKTDISEADLQFLLDAYLGIEQSGLLAPQLQALLLFIKTKR